MRFINVMRSFTNNITTPGNAGKKGGIMPNWCFNKLMIKGGNVEQILSRNDSGDLVLNFEKKNVRNLNFLMIYLGYGM